MNDYRLNEFSPEYRASEHKNALKEAIAKDHPNAKNMYGIIQRHFAYKKKLGHAYGDRCAYCGVSTDCVSYAEFEIDHIVSKYASAKGEAVAPTGVNSVENLAFACRTCNGRKREFAILEQHLPLLSPD